MRKYYLHDGANRLGPYNLEELKTLEINAKMPVWCEGMPRWSLAGSVDELKILFTVPRPPSHPDSLLIVRPPEKIMASKFGFHLKKALRSFFDIRKM